MADPFTAIAATASLASAGLGAYSAKTQAEGVNAADQYKAAQLERAARVGEIQADQTSADLTRRLNQTLGNIAVMRAAGHDDPSSPTGAAFSEYQEGLGENQRAIAVTNIKEQVLQQRSDAAYLNYAGQQALFAGDLGAGATLLKTAGSTNFSTFGFGGVNGAVSPELAAVA